MPPISLLLAITAEQMPYGQEYPKIFPPPQPACEVGMLETALMLWEHCSRTAKTLVFYQHLPSYQYKTQLYKGC